MIGTTIGVAIIAAVGFWLVGGIVLRVGGALIALAGAVGLALNGNANGILVFVIGIVLWLAGHWHFALRHHEYKSPLAQRVFEQLLPARLDPTRGWAIPVASDSQRGARGTANSSLPPEPNRPLPPSD